MDADRIDLRDLVETHQAGVWRYLRFLGCRPEQAEDLTQETFLVFLRKPFVQRSAASTVALLRKIARDHFADLCRRIRLEPALKDLDAADAVWRARMEPDGGEAYLAALRACLESLDDRERRALSLRYEEKASRRETGEALGLSEEGVKTLLRRARARLEKCIERRTKDE